MVRMISSCWSHWHTGFLYQYCTWICCTHILPLTLQMLGLLTSKAQECKDFWKSIKTCHVGIHWIAHAENSQMSTHVPGFQSFSMFLHPFVLAKLVTSSIRVKESVNGSWCVLLPHRDIRVQPTLDNNHISKNAGLSHQTTVQIQTTLCALCPLYKAYYGRESKSSLTTLQNWKIKKIK